ncbi:MAG: hypothetical protein FWJ66_12865 [Caldibacillus sp.]
MHDVEEYLQVKLDILLRRTMMGKFFDRVVLGILVILILIIVGKLILGEV